MTDMVNLDKQTGMAALATFIQRYPAMWAQFKDHADVLTLLVTSQAEGWAPDRFQQALMNTAYWKGTNEASRAWDALAATDPGEAKRQQAKATKALRDNMSRLGLANNKGSHAQQTSNFLQDIYKVTSQGFTQDQIADYLVAKYHPKTVGQAKGEIQANMGAVRGAMADYALPGHHTQALTYALQIAKGQTTLDGVKGNLAQQARGLYAPEIGQAIDEGKTVRQWADPYISLAASNLEMGADEIDLSNPKWQSFLNQPDPADPAKKRVMTTGEWQAKLRTDPTYGFDRTANARQSATQMANQIAQAFGAKG